MSKFTQDVPLSQQVTSPLKFNYSNQDKVREFILFILFIFSRTWAK